MLNCAIKCQRLDLMKDFYENMKLDNIAPNSVILSTLVKGFNRTKNYQLAFSLYENMPETQLEKIDIVFFNSLLDCCVESNNFEKMDEIFKSIKSKELKNPEFKPNVITYSTILKGLTKSNKHNQAVELYNQLKNSDMNVDEIFFNTMADYYSRKKNTEKCLEILNDMKKLKIIRSSVIYSIVIKLYSQSGDEINALKIYEEMVNENIKPTLITYTTIMQMFIKQKKLDKALDIFFEMRRNKIHIDMVTYNFIINGCSFNKKLEKAIELLIMSLDENIMVSDNTYNNVLEYIVSNKFMKINDRCKFAGEILQKLKERNFQVKYEVYSIVMKMMYKSGEKKANKEIENFNKFSNNGFHRGGRFKAEN